MDNLETYSKLLASHEKFCWGMRFKLWRLG
jgi:hypothetical protein